MVYSAQQMILYLLISAKYNYLIHSRALKWVMGGVFCFVLFCFVCVCLAYTSDDNTRTHRGPKTGPRKTLAKNAENVMFYHLRGGPRSEDLNELPTYYIYEDTRVLRSISKASRCVCVCVCVNFVRRIDPKMDDLGCFRPIPSHIEVGM